MMMKKIKILKVCLIFIAIIIVATTLYGEWKIMKDIEKIQQEQLDFKIYSKSTQERQKTSRLKWKTYRNEKYGFEIDYPNDWKTVRYEDDRFVIYKKSLDNRRNFAIGVTTEIVLKYCYGSEWKPELEPRVFACPVNDEGFGLHTYKEIKTTYGVKGFLGEGGGALFGPIKAAVFALPRKKTVRGQVWFIIAVIYYRLDTDYTSKDLEIFNQVISSFRYITSQWMVKEIETKIYPGAVY